MTKTPPSKARSKAHAKHEAENEADEYELDAGVEPMHPDTEPDPPHENEKPPDWRTVLEDAWKFMQVRDQQSYDRAHAGMIKLGIIKE